MSIERDATQALIDELGECLYAVLAEQFHQQLGEPQRFNAGANIAYADAIRLLARLGKVQITEDDGSNYVAAVSLK